jgi:hypothetical protein
MGMMLFSWGWNSKNWDGMSISFFLGLPDAEFTPIPESNRNTGKKLSSGPRNLPVF